jgi:hypothetical protein
LQRSSRAAPNRSRWTERHGRRSSCMDLDVTEHGVRDGLRRRDLCAVLRTDVLAGVVRHRAGQRSGRDLALGAVQLGSGQRPVPDGVEPAGVRLPGQFPAGGAELADRGHRMVRREQRERSAGVGRIDRVEPLSVPGRGRRDHAGHRLFRAEPDPTVRAIRVPGVGGDLRGPAPC